jgi:mono/diheme cytochrome c family protein
MATLNTTETDTRRHAMHRLTFPAAARLRRAFTRLCAGTLAGASLAMAALVAVAPALADSRNMLPRNELAAYTQECAACHMGFAPGFLPASSWNHMMKTLDKHYGTDASLDAATVQQISTWLAANAGTYKRVAEAPA